MANLAFAHQPIQLFVVKLIDQVRRDNLGRLQKECGSLRALAKLLERDESQVSQWKLGSIHSGTGKARGMRSETARYIEAKCGRPPGWLDTDHSSEPVVLSMPSGILDRKVHSESFEDLYLNAPARAWEHHYANPEWTSIFIPLLDVTFGKDNVTSQAKIRFVTSQAQIFGADWIAADQLHPDQIGHIEITDDSMYPTLERGDKVAVDTAQQDVVDAKTFLIAYSGEKRVRRLFRLPTGGLRIEADNRQRFPAIELDAAQAESVQIIGRCMQRRGPGSL